jgi:hypothetical protein
MRAKPERPAQRKVARVAVRVLRVLARFDRLGARSKEIAREARLPLRTAQLYLTRLVSDEVIQEPERGRYVYVSPTRDILIDPEGLEGLHGIVLASWKLREDPLRKLLCARYPGLVEYGPTRYGETILDWAGHLVRLRLYRSGRLLVYVPSTRSPIRFREFGEFVGWLSGVLYPLGPGDLEVVQIGVNVDYGGWLLKGIKAVELRQFQNASEQLYQKLGAVRHEVHLRPRDLALDQAVRIIREGSPTAQLERLLRLEVRLSQRAAENAAGGPGRRAPETLKPADALEGGYG